jgi:predicted Zn-dependent protease
LLDGLRLDRPLHPLFLEWDADLLILEGQAKKAIPKLRALLRLSPGSKGILDKLRKLNESTEKKDLPGSKAKSKEP